MEALFSATLICCSFHFWRYLQTLGLKKEMIRV